MPKYRVMGTVIGSKYLGEVEASSKEEAIQKAEELDQYIGLCHQCYSECVDPEVEKIYVEKVD